MVRMTWSALPRCSRDCPPGALPDAAPGVADNVESVLACRLLGHRYRFTSEGVVMTWECQRGCGAFGRKLYEMAEQAANFTSAFGC